jgi:FkbM family methyltransferase
MRLWSRGDDSLSDRVYWRGWDGWEPEVSRLFFRLAQRSPLTLDIGAHVGYYTLLASLANRHGRVLAFEPMEEMRIRLERHARLNGLGNVQVVAAAVTDFDGTVDLFHSSDEVAFTASTSREFAHLHRNAQLTKVPAVRLDRFLESRNLGPVGLVKLDIEAAEPEAVSGMLRTLERDRPPIFCEVLPGFDADRRLEELLGRLGYRFMLLTSAGPVVRERVVAHKDWRWLNYLFACDPAGLGSGQLQ